MTALSEDSATAATIAKPLMRSLLRVIDASPWRLGPDGETRDAYTTDLLRRRYALARKRSPEMSDEAFARFERRCLFNAASDMRRRREGRTRRALQALHSVDAEEVAAPGALANRVEARQQVARLRRLLPYEDYTMLQDVSKAGSVRAFFAERDPGMSLRTMQMRYLKAQRKARAVLADLALTGVARG